MNAHTPFFLLLPTLLLVLLVACDGDRDVSERAELDSVRRAVDSLKHLADSTRDELQRMEARHDQEHAELDHHLRCEALVALPGSIVGIVGNPRPYVHDDSCGLELIDQLAARYARLRDTMALRALDAMASEAHGSAGDYLSDALVELLLDRPADLFRYLTSHRGEAGPAIEKSLIDGIRSVPPESPRGRRLQTSLQGLESDRTLNDLEREHVRDVEEAAR